MNNLIAVVVLVIVCIYMIFLTGCATVTVEKDGCKATYTTFAKDIEAASFDVCGSKADVIESRSKFDALAAILGALK